jgi:hypothetical protein
MWRFNAKAGHPKTMNKRNVGIIRSVSPYNPEDKVFWTPILRPILFCNFKQLQLK